jgi:hypothetical protein
MNNQYLFRESYKIHYVLKIQGFVFKVLAPGTYTTTVLLITFTSVSNVFYI